MNSERENDTERREIFSRMIGSKQARRLRAASDGGENVWMFFSAFGAIGWLIALPAVGGALLGIWLDTKFPSRYSWTLMLLSLGIVAGGFGAWRWIEEQRQEIEEVEEKGARDHDD
ncbi:MAG: AtpZ/AtpI family protein [Candidatus Obscuribacterales bacterium]|nr:AtpZ/AtpI family protein [Candidatus Obscuribacterales bacterium]